MLVHVKQVLTPDELATIRERLAKSAWIDGRATAGHQASRVKENLQLPENDAGTRELSAMVLRALERNPMFISAALPRHVYPPMFNRYEPGMNFGAHVDNAIRQVGGTPHRVRTDIACTLFLSGPDEYDGGELSVEDTYGIHSVKLPAGDMIVYPASSLHRVMPVTRGARNAAFFWVQSMVKDDGERTLLLELDRAIAELGSSNSDNPAVVRLMAIYHNLVRKWAET